ncbi:MAG TPA: hypothetical protein VFE25_12240 [Opitutaceae bacterium]|jgi:hypothetical protein|nr:hypothetical protein [Opitutaceae bacterium]
MKKINRIALGTLSSLLLSAGMTKTAERLDPLSSSNGCSNADRESAMHPSMSCIGPCNYQPE